MSCRQDRSPSPTPALPASTRKLRLLLRLECKFPISTALTLGHLWVGAGGGSLQVGEEDARVLVTVAGGISRNLIVPLFLSRVMAGSWLWRTPQ
jgi:hypothetical protein